MRILAIAEFDPAGVLGGHRKALRAIGADYRLAVTEAYPMIGKTADWELNKNQDEISAFAAEADILQFHPVIGQPWSYTTLHPHFVDGEDQPVGIDWKQFPKARRISYFHGSRNAAVNASTYAKHWRTKGHEIWTSTLDYVHWMNATYAPPIVDYIQTPAVFRDQNDPLVIAHAPTDPANCHTEEFLRVARGIGAVAEFLLRLPRVDVLKRKKLCNAGFDHLRGAFSVNTVENMFLGLVPLVGVKREYLDKLEEEIGTPPMMTIREMFPIETLSDLERYMRKIDDDVGLHVSHQHAALNWTDRCWNSDVLAWNLLKKYEQVLAS